MIKLTPSKVSTLPFSVPPNLAFGTLICIISTHVGEIDLMCINRAHLVLLPKADDDRCPSNFLPISLSRTTSWTLSDFPHLLPEWPPTKLVSSMDVGFSKNLYTWPISFVDVTTGMPLHRLQNQFSETFDSG
jgi:hypothetical protein